MRRIARLFVIGVSAFLSISAVPAIGHDMPSAVLLAERLSSDIKVVMYMTPW